MTKSCVICGEEFKPRGPQKTCSEDCREKREKNRCSVKYQRTKVSRGIIACSICGNYFHPKNSKDACSVECREKRTKKYDKIRKLRHKKQVECSFCGMEFMGSLVSVYCSEECGNHGKKKRDIEYGKNYRVKNNELIKEKALLRRLKPENKTRHRNYAMEYRKTKTLLMLMALPSAIKETANQTNP